MIKAIYSENVFNLLESLDITLALFSMMPDEGAIPTTTYWFTQIVSDNIVSQSTQGYYIKQARVSITIVCKEVLGVADTPERVLRSMIDTITNQLKLVKTHEVDGITINAIREDTVSPIFNDNERYFIVKDYLFTYSATYNE